MGEAITKLLIHFDGIFASIDRVNKRAIKENAILSIPGSPPSLLAKYYVW